jgi:serine/threonine-protein kinase
MIGTSLGKYRIVEKLGRGGMGTVYKAIDETLDREVAIKVLNPDLTDPDLLKRFRAEAVTLARLNHPGIATLFELHHQDDELVMVMEFVRGETFHDLADRLGPLAPPQAAHLCMQVLDALGHAHRAGVVHRDLKPANLMITEAGAIKVMDFGIARVLGSEHFTHGGYMMGTPAYMAPEQVLGREIDGRADLYSVGVVFYRLLTGHLPFSADTAISMVQKQIADAPTPIGTFRPDLPPWCTTIVERSLAKQPSDRFQSAEEFRAALASAVTPQTLGELPTLSTPSPPGLRLDPDLTQPRGTPTRGRTSMVSPAPTPSSRPTVPMSAPQPVATLPTPTNTPAPERTTTVVLGRQHLAALGALLVIVVIGIALLAFAALRGGSTPQPTQTAAVTSSPPAVGATPPVQPPAPDSAPPAAPLPPPPSPAAGDKPPAPTSATERVPATPPGTTPPAKDRTIATAGAVPSSSPVKPDPRQSPTPGTVPPSDAAGARGARGSAATRPKETPPPPAATPPEPEKPALPAVTFSQVRVLAFDSGKARERLGSLQLGDRYLAVLEGAAGTAILSIPYSSLNGIFYARAKQPKWRDANGQEVESRIDLGPMGFFRGERNWIILLTSGDPIILRIEDPALKTVLPALQERSGIKIQR